MNANNLKVLEAKINKSDIPNVYKHKSKIYDIWANAAETKARAKCLELAQIKDRESVLEVAVGTGLTFEEILKANPSGRNEGIDLTKEMLGKAQEKASILHASNYNLSVGDAYSLTFEDNSFDLVINNYMFDLLPESDFLHVLSEFKRVLKPGGRLVLVNMTKGIHWYNYIWETIYKIAPGLIGGCRGVLMQPYIEKLGFREIKREYISEKTFPSEILIGIKP